MKDKKIMRGYVVQLKSGGAKMTVSMVSKHRIEGYPDNVTVHWIDNDGKPYKALYPEDTLEIVNTTS